MSHTTLLAGASGLVGRELLRALLADTDTIKVHAVVRRRLRGAGHSERLREWPARDFSALPALPPADEALCALGTTIKQAGSQEAFRAADLDAVLGFARAARAAGVRSFGVVSALGADEHSGVFYNRVKGEMENALAGLGFASLVIARPSLLLGDRRALGQPVRPLERVAMTLVAPLGPLIPARWRPVPAVVVAVALLRALRQQRPGVRVLESAQLWALCR